MRYITANASGRVPLETQLILWCLFDRMNPSYRDYLQIFNLSRQDGKQLIRHHQEKPAVERKRRLHDRRSCYGEGVYHYGKRQ